ncbi:MAG: hypothetical protein H6742_14200 [Alphaproteobacteria bacterium]|nr:hypothetical protein [Alphaproteobacteria bacterium]
MAVARADIDRGLTTVTGPFLVLLTALHALLGGRTEIRILRDGVVWSALIGPEDVEALVAALRPVGDVPREVIPRGDHPRSGEANIYFTLGAVRPDRDGATGLPLRRAKGTTKDADIVASPWVVVDVDPEREPKGRSSTDAEKAAARVVAEAIAAAFGERGVPTVLADSGNGWHLLARAVPAKGSEAVRAHAEGCKKLLHALDALYSTAAAKVDKAVHNASRIFKLYGTVSAKGTDTPEAPHRLSTIDPSAIPAEVDALALLADLVAPSPKAKAPGKAPPPGRPPRAPSEAPEWKAWRSEALARLNLDAVYGDWLTGKDRGNGWLECRDPASPSGDQHPSAGVADGSGQAERAAFHRFRNEGETLSVFDFLVEVGRAADFAAARRVVAELSGVPLPARRGPAPEVTLESFSDRWTAAVDDAERDRLLRAALRLAVALPTVQQDAALEALRETTGLARRPFNAAVTEARRAARKERREEAARPAPANPSLPVVEYVKNADTLDGLAEKILAVIVPTRRFFRFEHGAVYVHKGRGPILLDEKNLPGILAAYLELAMLVDTEEGRAFLGYEALPLNLSRALIHNPRFRSKLPVLTAYARSPVFDLRWKLVASFGWHEPSGIFYDGPEVRPRDGDVALRAAIDGFAWKEEADRVNLVGALLTMLSIPHWTRGHPFLAINGNKPGVGKSTLGRVLAAIVEGQAPPTVSYVANDEEFEKQIATRIEAGDRVLIVDNAKATTAISSPVLERCITDAKLSFRRLGSNTAISRPQNDVLFVLTMNMTQLGPDLRRRALPLNLEVVGNVRHATYAADDPVGDVLAARVDVLGELAGMVRSWVEAGRPMPEHPARHSTSQRWAATIDAILRHAGMPGFLSNFEESEHAFDPDYAAVRDVAAAHHDDGFHTAGEWAEVLVDGPLSDKLRDRRGDPKPPRARATIVGQLLGQYLDETFDTPDGPFVLRQETPRKGHPSLYGFEPAPP